MIEKVLRDHDRIRELAERLGALFREPQCCDMDVLAKLRWEMASTIMAHLAFEDRHVYSKLESDPRPDVNALGKRFQAELRDIFGAYCAHARNWPPSRIAADWALYRITALTFVARLFARTDREELELYPLVERAGIDTMSSNLVTTRWAGEAFTIKERIGA